VVCDEVRELVDLEAIVIGAKWIQRLERWLVCSMLRGVHET
jgi:hypothetical protein